MTYPASNTISARSLGSPTVFTAFANGCAVVAVTCALGCAASSSSPPNPSPDAGEDSPSMSHPDASPGADASAADASLQDAAVASTDASVADQSSGDATVARDANGVDAMGDAAAGSVDCSSLPLCDDFESDTAGMAPNATLWHLFMGCNPNATNGPVTGGGLMVGIDNTIHHSGTNSLRVVGGDSCGVYAINTSAFAQLGQQVYGRFYARFSGPAGGAADASAATQNHNGFLSMYSGSPSGTDPSFFTNYNNPTASGSGQLRLGFQMNAVDWNNVINKADTTLPDQDPMGVATSISPAADQWNCFEFHIDQTNNHIEAWFNSAAVAGLTWDGGSTQGIDDQWASQGPPPLQLQSFGLGWLQLNDKETAWYDDVALAGTRIGCQ